MSRFIAIFPMIVVGLVLPAFGQVTLTERAQTTLYPGEGILNQQVLDLNGDGTDDLVLSLYNPAAHHFRILALGTNGARLWIVQGTTGPTEAIWNASVAATPQGLRLFTIGGSPDSAAATITIRAYDLGTMAELDSAVVYYPWTQPPVPNCCGNWNRLLSAAMTTLHHNDSVVVYAGFAPEVLLYDGWNDYSKFIVASFVSDHLSITRVIDGPYAMEAPNSSAGPLAVGHTFQSSLIALANQVDSWTLYELPTADSPPVVAYRSTFTVYAHGKDYSGAQIVGAFMEGLEANTPIGPILIARTLGYPSDLKDTLFALSADLRRRIWQSEITTDPWSHPIVLPTVGLVVGTRVPNSSDSLSLVCLSYPGDSLVIRSGDNGAVLFSQSISMNIVSSIAGTSNHRYFLSQDSSLVRLFSVDAINVSPPVAPGLSAPRDGAVIVTSPVSLAWQSTGPAVSFHVQVARDPNFSPSQIIFDSTTAYTSNSASISAVDPIGTYYLRIAATNPFGETWSAVRSFVTAFDTTAFSWTKTSWTSDLGTGARGLLSAGAVVYCGAYNPTGMIVSHDSGSHWTGVHAGLPEWGPGDAATAWCFTLDPRSWSIGERHLFVGTGLGVSRTTDDGTSWTTLNNGLLSRNVFALHFSGDDLYAGTWGGGVYLSSNSGGDWKAVNTGLWNAIVNTIVSWGTVVYAGTNGGVFRSNDRGAYWTPVNVGLPLSSDRCVVSAMAVIPPAAPSLNALLFAGVDSGGVFRSSNGGDSWSAVNTGISNARVRALIASGRVLYLATDDMGVYVSSTYGDSWAIMNRGLSTGAFYSLAAGSLYLYGGNYLGNGDYHGGVWRRPIPATGLGGIDFSTVPSDAVLLQNYPNPFNPSTTILYSVPQGMHVVLKLYNSLGQEVRTLVNADVGSGWHVVVLDGNGLASGCYFYRLQADGRATTRALLVVH